jgi:hypothetical protein
MKILMRDFGYL